MPFSASLREKCFWFFTEKRTFCRIDYFLSELSERNEESPFLQHTGALAEILHFVQDDKKEKQDDRSDAQKFVTLSEREESPLVRLTHASMQILR